MPDSAGFAQPVSGCLSAIASSMSAHLGKLIAAYGGMDPSSTRPPEFAATEPRAIAAVVMGMDFFSQTLDRRFLPGDAPVDCDFETSAPNATTASSQLPIVIPESCPAMTLQHIRDRGYAVARDKNNGHLYLRCAANSTGATQKASCVREECRGNRGLPWCFVANHCGGARGPCRSLDGQDPLGC
mmetsp:Transcript_107874/g.304969  ORF Transcript_107874/g.304969 Transcript_107874/m.304969 type:complete len:185 (+) Transcript_107874:2-556(+)